MNKKCHFLSENTLFHGLRPLFLSKKWLLGPLLGQKIYILKIIHTILLKNTKKLNRKLNFLSENTLFHGLRPLFLELSPLFWTLLGPLLRTFTETGSGRGATGSSRDIKSWGPPSWILDAILNEASWVKK